MSSASARSARWSGCTPGLSEGAHRDRRLRSRERGEDSDALQFARVACAGQGAIRRADDRRAGDWRRHVRPAVAARGASVRSGHERHHRRDGRWIAYFAGRAPDPQSTLELWLVSAEGGAARVLTDGMTAISGDGFDWSATSDALLFASGQDNELWSVSVPEGRRRRLSETGAWDDPWKGLPTWQPVARASAVAYVGGLPLRVMALSLPDGRRRDVSRLVDYSYAWAPNGRAIVYAIPRGLAIVPLDGGEPRPLTTDGGVNPVWPPNGSPIAYLGRPHCFAERPLDCLRPVGVRSASADRRGWDAVGPSCRWWARAGPSAS